MSATPSLPQPGPLSLSRMAVFFAVLGPGLVVMLADTDVGSVITGACWRCNHKIQARQKEGVA